MSETKLFGKYHDFALLLISLIFTSVVGGYLGFYFQERSWNHHREEELRETERVAATRLFEELSSLMDRRLYRMRRIFWGYETGANQGEMIRRWDAYREVLFQWNENLNRNLALTQRYFGLKSRLTLEMEISEQFRQLDDVFEQLRKKPAINEEFKHLDELMDKLNNATYDLDVTMIRQIQRGEVGLFNPELDQVR